MIGGTRSGLPRSGSYTRSVSESRTVLLIEDSVEDADLVTAMLGKSADAFRCEWARTLADGCAKVRERPPACVLLDLDLTDGDGPAALDAVVSAAPALPVIVLTGRDDPVLGEDALRRGAQDYLDKGWTNQRLLTRAVRNAARRNGNCVRPNVGFPPPWRRRSTASAC